MSRRGRQPGKGYAGPWYSLFPERLRFELEARRAFPGLKGTLESKVGYVLRLPITVPGSGSLRFVRIEFVKSRVPHVFVDGSKSKHRNYDDSLCMWDPRDADENRWVFEDGLLDLIGHIAIHLLREEWWRETGKWFGPEAPHGATEVKEPPDRRPDGD